MLRRPYDAVKRAIDLFVGSVALIVSAPVQAMLAVVVQRKLGSPVLTASARCRSAVRAASVRTSSK